jgi:hypothetical protein
VLVVSRGGTASWYQPFATRYADVFDSVSPEAFKAQHDARVAEIGEQKQTRVTAFERDLLATIVDRAGIRRHRLLHPSVMYDVPQSVLVGTCADWVGAPARAIQEARRA